MTFQPHHSRSARLPSRRQWRRLPVLVLIAVAAACSDSGTPRVAANDTVESYISAAFVRVPEGAPPGTETVLGKRRSGVPVSFFVLPGESMDKQSEILLRHRELADVLADLAAHSDDFTYRLFSPEEMVPVMLNGFGASGISLEDAVVIQIGSIADIEGWLGGLDAGDPNTQLAKQLFLQAKAAARTKGAPVCFYLNFPRTAQSAELVRSVLFVERTNKAMQCHYSQIMSAFGLMGGLPKKAASMFSHQMTYELPTPLDWKIWEMHLDPRLTSGMLASEVRAIGPVIVEELSRPETDSASLVHPQVLLDDGEHLL